MNLKSVFHSAMLSAVKVQHAMTNVVLPALQKLENSKPTIETVTAAIDPAAVSYEDFVFNVGAEIVALIEAGQSAAEKKLSDAGLDVATVAAAKQVLASIQARNPSAKSQAA